jgi:cyanophycinase
MWMLPSTFSVWEEGTMHTTSRGALFLIGGAAELVFADFVRLAGGPSAHIVVITHASSSPRQSGNAISDALRKHGVTRVTVITPRGEQRLPTDTDAVYIGGGDQNRLVRLLDASGLAQQIRDANRRGALVAGTSAGAAAASYVMMAGETDDYRKGVIKQGTIRLGIGLCLRSGVVVDTHFGERKRHARLRMAVGTMDAVIGVGLDEDTAAYITGNDVEVFGAGKVWVYTAGGGTDFETIARAATERNYSVGEKFTL